MSTRYLDVMVDVPAVGDRRFTYSCPPEIVLPRGAKVRVPFARASVDGYVVGAAQDAPQVRVKAIEYVYDLKFLPKPSLLELGERLANHYCASTPSMWSCLWPVVAPRKSVARLLKEMGEPDAAHGGSMDVNTESVAEEKRDVPPELVWGKSEFRWKRYITLIRRTLLSGKGVLFLMPELKGLTLAWERLSREFPHDVCQYHSEMTGVTRRDAHLALANGEKRLALGTRSAVFAPVKNLGLIVVDEEPGASYKSLEFPFYDARTVARKRASQGVELVFGASHPSVEAVWNAGSEGWSTVFEEEPTPESRQRDVVFLDMKNVRPSREIISQPLYDELCGAFSAGKRAVLLLNRRGNSSQVSCQDCGSAIICPKCGVPLSHHAKEGKMVCHTCGLSQDAPLVCPTCGGHRWRMSGIGIEKAESEFKEKFPGIPVFRLDNDSSKSVSPHETARMFEAVSPSCLLATQMVLGVRLPSGIGVVGVLSADTALSVPDYRAGERAYQLLAALGDLIDSSDGARGVYVIQTRNPDHHAVKGVADRDLYYETELQNRRMLGYPPFKRIFNVKFGGKTPLRVEEAAFEFASLVSADADVRVLGPVPAPKPKVRGLYWWQMALRGDDHETMALLCRRALSEVSRTSAVRVVVDVDPVDMG